MNILKKALIVLALTPVISQANMVFCMKELGRDMMRAGSFTNYVRGPGLLIDFKGQNVAWVGTGGSMVKVVGYTSNGKPMVETVSGSNPTSEPILDSSTRVLGEGFEYEMTLADSLGGYGYLNYRAGVLAGFDSASWSNRDDATEDFPVCVDVTLN
jgi:hypothetical protein